MALRLLLPLLLLAAALLVYPARGIGSQASDCCLKNSRKNIPSGWVKSYSLQGPETGCPLRAVVFTTRKNKKLCASPTDAAVQKLMQKMDKKKAQSTAPRRKASRQKGQRT
ncbi:C-C motif chemokine 21a-like [Apteryx mantelli]|uniref:C-C motif chemokine n=1 Tax=Apteryx mantelli TaxID=2696672 RepID=A0A8B7JB32_9AVES|nr:PREDICTED: C-C motif chemokine 21a-like [Apteryx mantelli mantelli]